MTSLYSRSLNSHTLTFQYLRIDGLSCKLRTDKCIVADKPAGNRAHMHHLL